MVVLKQPLLRPQSFYTHNSWNRYRNFLFASLRRPFEETYTNLHFTIVQGTRVDIVEWSFIFTSLLFSNEQPFCKRAKRHALFLCALSSQSYPRNHNEANTYSKCWTVLRNKSTLQSLGLLIRCSGVGLFVYL